MRLLAAAALAAAAFSSFAHAQEGVDPLDAATRIPRIAIRSLVLVGEDHPAPDLGDFPAAVEGDAAVSASWIERSVKWVRLGDGVPLPRARLRVEIRAAPEKVLLRWRGHAVTLQEGERGSSFTELWVPLLEGGVADVSIDGRPAARIKVAAKPVPTGEPSVRHAIDHSCSPWHLKISGLDDAYLSITCRMTPVGRVLKEEAMLEVRWTAAGVSLPDGSPAPMAAQLRDGRPARVAVIGPDGRSRVVEISATVPPRLHRMRLAWGAGPYRLSSSAASGNGAAASVSLYENFRLRTAEDGMSIRAFDAAVSQSPTNTAFFNNLGLYFAYDLARVWDQRLRITALLGVQAVTFSPQGLARRSYSTTLAPQGFELSYPDAFGRKNETLSAGLFLQPTTSTPYQNYWLRYGGTWFAEVNSIYWRSNDRYARMTGVSIGRPFASLF